jgi:hypothetical protein
MKKSSQKNQGEGNRDADREYRKNASEFARSGKQHRAAEEAKREVEQNEKR